MSKYSWAFLIAGLVLGAGFSQLRAAEPAAVAATTQARVFEIRTYHCLPGRLDALHKRFREHTRRIFEKHGMTNVGYWVPQDDPAHQDTLIYIISHASREQATKNWADFRNDPEWKKVSSDSEANGKIVEKVVSVYMDPTDFSKLK